MTSEFKIWIGTYVSISFCHLNNPSSKTQSVKVPFIKVKSIHFSGETRTNGVGVLKGYLGCSVPAVLSLFILLLLPSIPGQRKPPVVLRLLLAAKVIRNSNLSSSLFLQVVTAIFFSQQLGNTLLIYDPVQMSYGGSSNWNIFL